MKHLKKITLPIYLTLLRLIGAPILVPFFIVHYISYNDFITNLLVSGLFLFFGFTDFLDGYFARRYGQVSIVGATLDHIADKVLTFSAFVALLAVGKISYVLVLLLVGRELFMMGLREIALENNLHIAVSSWGKLKTVLHILLITWIIANPMQSQISLFWNGTEIILLCLSLLVSWVSALYYFIPFYYHLKSR